MSRKIHQILILNESQEVDENQNSSRDKLYYTALEPTKVFHAKLSQCRLRNP